MILIYWLFFALLLLFISIVMRTWKSIQYFFTYSIRFLYHRYKFFEFGPVQSEVLPTSPTNKEKFLYRKRNHRLLTITSIVSFVGIQISMFNFLVNNILMWPLLGYFFLLLIQFLVSLIIDLFSKDFDINHHTTIVAKWQNQLSDRVDIFLPTAGEPIETLNNTWEGVKEMISNYHGKIVVYCLDDAARPEVRTLAERYSFHYETRPNKGYFKKAGNLLHGFLISESEYIAIFDADFRPRKDFLEELLPYFHEDPRIGIVQSPQYFDVVSQQNWLQRGAGAVQELFYRLSQVSRQSHEASICVGSNAIYKRAALAEIGGPFLIEHSEDVFTGFAIRSKGWTIQYVPIILAKGLCPSDLKAYFKQQYRWCLGSMSLLFFDKFWRSTMSDMTRLSYFSGFLYYILTGINSVLLPIIPLALIIFYPDQINIHNYFFILPSIIFLQVIYPLWHKSTYGIEAIATKLIYGWAHLFAIFDTLTEKYMSWQATGSKMGKDNRYIIFRILQYMFNVFPAIAWLYLSGLHIIFQNNMMFLPLFLGGIYFFLVSIKIALYHSKPLLFLRIPSLAYPFQTQAAGVLFILVLFVVIFSPVSFAYIENRSYKPIDPVPKELIVSTTPILTRTVTINNIPASYSARAK